MIRFISKTEDDVRYYLCDWRTAGRIYRKLERDYLSYSPNPILVKGRTYAIAVSGDEVSLINGEYFVRHFADDIRMT